jgi:type VI protein secretion system component Hcp
MKIEMTDVIISSVAPSGNPKGDGEFPTEVVGLNPSKYTWTYTQQDRTTGQAKGQVQTNWNLKTGATS